MTIIHDPSDVDEPTAVQRHEPTTAPEQIRQTALASSLESIDGLFRLAVQNRTPAAELRELMALHRETRQELARQAYFAALAAFQEEVGPVVKKRQSETIATRDGGTMQYGYANADDILSDVRPTMIRHGLSLKWGQELEGQNCTIVCTVMHIGGHSEVTRFTVPTETRAGMSPQQKVGAAGSYAQARVIGLALGVTTTAGEPQGIDPTPIDDEQVATIEQALEAKGVPLTRFLGWLRVEKVTEIRRVDYLRAMQALDNVKAKK